MGFNLADIEGAFDAPDFLSHNSAWIYHLPMVPVFIELLKPEVFVELGTFRGDSYMGFCQAVAKRGSKTRCTAVDTWEGDVHAGLYGPEVLADLRRPHDAKYSAFSRLLQKNFDAAVEEFRDATIDLLHIDGLHTYEAVKHDYETWLPKLSRRGVILFHDTQIRERDFGVWRLWEQVCQGRAHFKVSYGCGLGILAVGPEVPEAFLEFLRELAADQKRMLAVFFALGHRNELMRNSMMLVSKMHDVQEIANHWRKMTGQEISNATPARKRAWDEPIPFSMHAARDVGQLASDAVRLMAEVTQRRKVEPAAVGVPA